MSNEVAVPVTSLSALAELNVQTKDAGIAEMTSSRNLPWLTIEAKSGKKMDIDPTIAGQIVLNKSSDAYEKLGTEILCIPVGYRHKAADFNNKENIVNNYDRDSDEFKAIKTKAGEKNSNCIFGTEYLLLLVYNDTFKYVTFMLGSETLRNSSEELFAQLNKATKIASRKIVKGNFIWYGMNVIPSGLTESDLPKLPIDLMERISTFKNPPKEERTETQKVER